MSLPRLDLRGSTFDNKRFADRHYIHICLQLYVILYIIPYILSQFVSFFIGFFFWYVYMNVLAKELRVKNTYLFKVMYQVEYED